MPINCHHSIVQRICRMVTTIPQIFDNELTTIDDMCHRFLFYSTISLILTIFHSFVHLCYVKSTTSTCRLFCFFSSRLFSQLERLFTCGLLNNNNNNNNSNIFSLMCQYLENACIGRKYILVIVKKRCLVLVLSTAYTRWYTHRPMSIPGNDILFLLVLCLLSLVSAMFDENSRLL
jgi:hypothetical protein